MITFRGTKSGEDVHSVLSASAVKILKDYLAWRGDLVGDLDDREAKLFLTPDGKPYKDNGGRWGDQNKNAFKGARRRAQAAIVAAGEAKARTANRARQWHVAKAARAAAAADAALIGKVTQHWFRHRLATLWLRRDPRAAMEQGGWLDIRSIMGYSHDAPEFRRQVADELDPFKDPPSATRSTRATSTH
jgi:integrase